jgi:Transglutaminase-like superfamily
MNYKHRGLFALIATHLLALIPSAYGRANEETERLIRQANELARSQKYDQAIDIMKKAIGLEPSNDVALGLLSEMEFKNYQYVEGLEHAEKAIKINSKAGLYYTLAASNCWGNQDLERAREYCDTVLKGGPQEFGSGPCNDARVIRDMLVPRKYLVTWHLDPRKGQQTGGALAIAMPKADLPYQSATYEVEGAKSQRFIKGEVNDVLQVVPQGNKPLTLIMRVTVSPYSFKNELAKEAPPKSVPANIMVFLGPSDLINPKSPVLQKAVAGLKGKTNQDTARTILMWMKKNIEYKVTQKTPTELDFKSVDEIIERGHAECRGYAMLFTAMCRAAGVPARSVWGLTRTSPGQDPKLGAIASHNWSEFYVPGTGWVPVDPQAPESLGFLSTRHIRIFMDVKKSKTSMELLPLVNLTSMTSEPIKVEESR